MRPSESMDHPMLDNYITASMREPSPTEPNESFAYHFQYQADGVNVPLPPLPIPTSASANAKKDLLMSLFTNENYGESDFRTHKALTGLTPEELDTPIDTSSNTALIWAATLARRSLLRALISCGASPFRVNAIGETALMRACAVTNNLEKGTFPDLLELLGPTIEFRDSRGRTVLHHIAVTSAVKGRSQSSKYYLESLLEFVVRQGSHPNSQQSFSSGPPVKRSIPLGRFMSEIVNLRDRSGDTALNIASRIGNRSIISQLCEVGADSTIQNHSGLSPLDFGVVGDPSDLTRPREERALGKGVGNEAKESSNEIISCKMHHHSL